MNKGVALFWGAIILLIALGLGSSYFVAARPSPYNNLAQCIKSQGVIFYGAFWCPHCQRTKAMFGSAAKYLPYVECSTPDGKSQTQICIDKNIQSYPTWIRPDGASITGEHTISEISTFSGCTIEGAKTEFGTTTKTSSETTIVK